MPPAKAHGTFFYWCTGSTIVKQHFMSFHYCQKRCIRHKKRGQRNLYRGCYSIIPGARSVACTEQFAHLNLSTHVDRLQDETSPSITPVHRRYPRKDASAAMPIRSPVPWAGGGLLPSLRTWYRRPDLSAAACGKRTKKTQGPPPINDKINNQYCTQRDSEYDIKRSSLDRKNAIPGKKNQDIDDVKAAESNVMQKQDIPKLVSYVVRDKR